MVAAASSKKQVRPGRVAARATGCWEAGEAPRGAGRPRATARGRRAARRSGRRAHAPPPAACRRLLLERRR
jgi:hypothetical protein